MALTEVKRLGDWLKSEEFAPNFCREVGTLASGQNLKSGAVLCTNAAKYEAFDDDGGGTLGTATGILINDVDASLADAECVVLVRGPAVINKAGLTWHANNDSTDQTNGLVDLAALNIIAREGV